MGASEEFPEVSDLLKAVQTQDNKVARKKSLEKLQESTVGNAELCGSELSAIFDLSYRLLLEEFLDPSERCRELAAQLFLRFLQKLPASEWEASRPYLVSTIKSRLAREAEPSEEVRIVLLETINYLLLNGNNAGQLFFEDIVDTLAVTVRDVNSEAKVLSCEAVTHLGTKDEVDQAARLKAAELMEPLLEASCGHSHFKVRSAAVRAVGFVMAVVKLRGFDDVATRLRKISLDSNPRVRASLGSVAGDLLGLSCPTHDAYVKLLTLVLLGLHDEVEEVKNELRAKWTLLGETLGAKSNRLNGDDPVMEAESHRQAMEDRLLPTDCCKSLVKPFGKELITTARKDLADWTSGVRAQGGRLLLTTLCHLDDQIDDDLLTLTLACLFESVQDEDETVRECARKSAEVMGRSVRPKVWLFPMLKRLHDEPTVSGLTVFASTIRNVDKEMLNNHLEEIASVLAEDQVCRKTDHASQKYLLDCVETVNLPALFDHREAPAYVFGVLFSLLGVSDSDEIKSSARQQLAHFQRHGRFDSKKTMFNKFLGPFIKCLKQNAEDWSVNSAESCIFAGILKEAPETSSPHILEMIVYIFNTVLRNLKRPTALHVTFMEQQAEYLDRVGSSEELMANFRAFMPSTLEVAVPGLEYHPGAAAGMLRQASLRCVAAILSMRPHPAVAHALVGRVQGLTGDAHAETRCLACRALGLALRVCGAHGAGSFAELCQALRAALGDSSAVVRTEAAFATRDLLETLDKCNCIVERDLKELELLRPQLLSYFNSCDADESRRQLEAQTTILMKKLLEVQKSSCDTLENQLVSQVVNLKVQ